MEKIKISHARALLLVYTSIIHFVHSSNKTYFFNQTTS
jgi:hypothetical protein